MTQATKRNKGGRPSYKPTEEQRKTVRALVAYGAQLDEVARVLGITRPTLSKHFASEIETAATEANSKVAQSLYRKATSESLSAPAVTAAIFWLKTRGGWIEEDKKQTGKKEQRQQEAETAGQDSEWGGDLHPGSSAVN